MILYWSESHELKAINMADVASGPICEQIAFFFFHFLTSMFSKLIFFSKLPRNAKIARGY